MWKRLRPPTDLYLQPQNTKDKSFLSYAPQKSRTDSNEEKHYNINQLISRVKQKSVNRESRITPIQQKRNKTQFYDIDDHKYSIPDSPSKLSSPKLQSPKKYKKSKTKNLEQVIKKLNEVNKLLRKTVTMLLERFQDISKLFQSQLKQFVKKMQLPNNTIIPLSLIPDNSIKNKIELNAIKQVMRRPPTIQIGFTDLQENDTGLIFSFNNQQKRKVNYHINQNPKNTNLQNGTNNDYYSKIPERISSSIDGHFHKQKHTNQQEPLENRNRASSIKSTKSTKQMIVNFNQTLNEMKQLMEDQPVV